MSSGQQPGTVPSQEQMQQGAQVVEAGQQAAAAEADPQKKRGAAARAIKRSAGEKGWELSDDQADKLAGAIAGKLEDLFSELPDKTVEGIRQAGGFDKLPEPVTAPAAPTGTGTLPSEPPGAAQPDQSPDEAPGSGRSRGAGAFARWFRSG